MEIDKSFIKEKIGNIICTYTLKPLKELDGFIFAKDLTICGKKCFFYSESLLEMFNYIYSLPSTQRCFYECIKPNVPCKAHMDLDFKCNADDAAESIALISKLQNDFIEEISDGVGSPHILIADGPAKGGGGYKISRHIVIENLVYENNNVFLREQVNKTLKTLDSGFANIIDMSIYTRWRLFRLVDNCKMGSTRVLRWGKGQILFDEWKNLLVNTHTTQNIVRFTRSSLSKKHINATALSKWVCEDVVNLIEESGNCSLDTINYGSIYSPYTVSFRFERTKSNNCCMISRSLGNQGLHKSNGFSINVHLAPRTVFFYCFGTSGHKDIKQMRINIKIPDILLEDIKLIATEPTINIDVPESLYLETNGYIPDQKIPFENSLKGSYFYFTKGNQCECDIIGKRETTSRSEIFVKRFKPTTMRCLNCNKISTVKKLKL